jgi:hypothetical protein
MKIELEYDPRWNRFFRWWLYVDGVCQLPYMTQWGARFAAWRIVGRRLVRRGHKHTGEEKRWIKTIYPK